MAPGKWPPKGDFETMPSWTDKEAWKDWPAEALFHAPVFFAGEAKRVATGKDSETGSKNYRAQLQASIYPTLVQLLLVHHMQNPKAALPEYFVIYGLYYDEERIEIHAHFPFWKNAGTEFHDGDPDDAPELDLYRGWRFAQVRISTFELAKTAIQGDAAQAEQRIKLARALMAVRTQAWCLVTRFRHPDFQKSWKKLMKLQGTKLAELKNINIEARKKGDLADERRPRTASPARSPLSSVVTAE